MTMTLLELITEFTDRASLDAPTAVMATQDDTIRQLRALANEVISDITSRGANWPQLQKQASWTSVAAELQGTMATIAPYGFKSLVLSTAFDRTERRPLFGPRNGPRWQEAEALPQTGPFYSYRIWQGNLLLQPAPPAAHAMYFEYESDWAILAADGTTYKPRFTDDNDTFTLGDDLLLMGLRWKWRREKGQSYAQEKLDFEAQVTQAVGTQPTKGQLSLSGQSNGDIRPGIFVPLGDWPL